MTRRVSPSPLAGKTAGGLGCLWRGWGAVRSSGRGPAAAYEVLASGAPAAHAHQRSSSIGASSCRPAQSGAEVSICVQPCALHFLPLASHSAEPRLLSSDSGNPDVGCARVSRGLKPVSMRLEAVWPLCVWRRIWLCRWVAAPQKGAVSATVAVCGHKSRRPGLQASSRTITPVWA